jgi:predicted translin family RNA/ssDNA-binding protein
MKLAIEHLKTQVESGAQLEADAQAEVDKAREYLNQAEAALAHVRQRNADFAQLYEAAKLGNLPKPEAVPQESVS